MRKKLIKSIHGTLKDEATINQLGYTLIDTTYDWRRKLLKNIIVPNLGVQSTIRVLCGMLEREKRSSKGTWECLARIEKYENDIKFLEILSKENKENREFCEKSPKAKTYIIIDGWVEKGI